MRKIWISFFSILSLFFTARMASAQQLTELTDVTKLPRVNYSIGYYGNSIWNPGALFGMEYTWKEKEKTKRKGKIVTYQYLLTSHLGGYWDPKGHVGIFSKNGLYLRKTNQSNRQITYGLSPLSYFRSFLPETYEVSDNGAVKKVVLPGRSYYAPTFTFGLGKLKTNKKWAAYQMNIHLMILLPYNADFLPSFNFEFGYRLNPKNKRVEKRHA